MILFGELNMALNTYNNICIICLFILASTVACLYIILYTICMDCKIYFKPEPLCEPSLSTLLSLSITTKLVSLQAAQQGAGRPAVLLHRQPGGGTLQLRRRRQKVLGASAEQQQE